MIPERLHAALIAKAAGIGHFPVTAHDHNFSVTQSNQGIHGAAGSLAVIGGHTGKVIKGQSGRIVGHQNTGYFDFTKVLQEILAVSAQEQNTQRFLFPA